MASGNEDILALLSQLGESSEVSSEELQSVKELVTASIPPSLPKILEDEIPAESEASNESPRALDIRTLIGKMSLPEKVKLAMFGNSVVRGLLIRDSNKLVQLFVLKNPKIMVKEIEDFAKNTNLSDHVLRAISASQSWTRSYAVKLGLVTNPKTPGDIAMKWLKFLSLPDVKKIAKSKNIPHLIVNSAKKRVADADEKR